MAVKAILPVSVFLFLIKWPLIGKSTLSLDNTVSLVLILTGNLPAWTRLYCITIFLCLWLFSLFHTNARVIGLILYRWATHEKEKAAANSN